LTFGWDGSPDDVFQDVSFRLDTDWRAGLVGRNGRGKTTLLRLLTDPESMPHSGTISSPVKFKYFPYNIADMSASTLDVIDAACPVYEFWELCRELNLLEVPEDVLFRPFETLSPGERTKALLATLFLGGGDFALLDEPTNHLDAMGKRAVAEYLRSKKGFLVVSHDRTLLDSVCDHTVSIGRAGIEVVSGSYSVWAEEKLRRDRREAAENEQLEKDIKRMKASERRAADWSGRTEKSKYGNGPVDRGYIGHKSAKLMKRSKAIEARRGEAARKKSELLKDVDTAGSLKLAPLRHHSEKLAYVSGLQIDYLPGKTFDMAIGRGERIALTGGNGAGKSSIIKLIAGERIPHTGIVKTAAGLKISYVPQDIPEMPGSALRFAQGAGVDLTQFLAILVNLGLDRSAFDTDLAQFSDGQKRKVLIAKSLCEPAHLYLWDEPLNFIDILSREQIERLILEYRPSMAFVEHDDVFVGRIATRTVSL
jgi:lincosamide and streptogramin A transport system ATP-binding/permease protein